MTKLSTAQAWERFASGDEVNSGVRPEILMSWHRCRDRYHVDPARSRAPSADGSPLLPPDETVVAAELGAAAMSIASEVEQIDGVVAVADGTGRILSAWGSKPALRHGATQNLGPMYAWSEPATGTTGVGTALATREAVIVNHHEHWCSAFHDWSCAAVAVCDPVSRRPVGVIDISVWRRPMPGAAVAWLGNAVRVIERRLAHSARRAPAIPAALSRPVADPLDDRLVGMHGDRLVLVALDQIRYVEISHGTLWLDTDSGRVRTPGRTLDRLAERLQGQGFMRVNRSTLVNLDRIRELAPSFKDGLWVLVDGSDTLIPVSRRRAAWFRSKLGL